nr:LysE family transporter [Deinococcota bacterium]
MSSYFAVLVSIMAVHAIAMISPGPNFFIVTQTAISHSRRNGVFVAFGIACAAALWSSAALLGLNLLFERASWLYQGVRVLGGAYLLYLGVQSWHYASHPLAVTAKVLVTPSGWQSFRTGFITNLTNPKSVVFFGGMFAALLPP